MRKLLLLALLWPSVVAAQPAATVVTTLRSTSTSATSLCVGSATTACGTATGGIKAGPVDVASVTSGGFVGIANNVPGDTTMRLYNNAGTLSWNGSPLSIGGSTVSGTVGKLAKFTGAAAVGDSICTEAGATITCVNTVSATTLTGTLSTVSQPNVTTMAGLISVGTIGTGVWQGTKVNLTYGGTNADLSGTGGTSQFLRQNTVGGTVTVVRPAVSDLSDAANVALIGAANTFTESQVISKAQNGGTGLTVNNATSDTAAHGRFVSTTGSVSGGVYILSQGYTTSGVFQQSSTLLYNDSAGGIVLGATHASGPLRLYTGGTGMRWGINAAGDFTFGASEHIADSSGTPTCNGSDCSSVIGTDYAFQMTGAVAGHTTAAVNFGHTWTQTPICVATRFGGGAATVTGLNTSTSLITISFSGSVSSELINVLCRGY